MRSRRVGGWKAARPMRRRDRALELPEMTGELNSVSARLRCATCFLHCMDGALIGQRKYIFLPIMTSL